MSKLEYNKENYLLKPKKLLETLEVFNPTNDTETLYMNRNVIAGSDSDINNNVVVSQLIRLVSLLSKSIDISALPQEQQDSINVTIDLFETYPMMGDQMLATDGRNRLEQAMINQETYANNNAVVTGETVITDPYQGFENIAMTSSLSEQERNRLIDAIFTQDVSVITDLDAGDQLIISDFIDTGSTGVLLGSYGPTPAGQDLHESLDISPGADLALIFTEHIKGGTIYNSDELLFVKVYA